MRYPVLLLTASLLTALIPAAAATSIWEDKEQFVRLEPQDDGSAPANAHPVELSSEEIGAALRSLQADSPKEESPFNVFTSVEIEILGDSLSKGLAQADPRQDVTFSIIGSHSRGGFTRWKRVNTGRVFYLDGKLNIIFGEVLGEYRKKNVYGQRDQDFRPRAYAQRTGAAEHKWSLVPGAGMTFHSQGGSERGDWLVVDTALASVAPTGEMPAAVSQTESSPPPPPPAPAPAADPTPPPPVVPVETTPGSAGQTESARPAEATSEVEQRLEQLKELRDKGLISEEVYQEKMREILSDL